MGRENGAKIIKTSEKTKHRIGEEIWGKNSEKFSKRS